LWGKLAKKDEQNRSELPLGWVNLQLIDYKHELRTGLISLNMWPNEKANVIGNAVPWVLLIIQVLVLPIIEHQILLFSLWNSMNTRYQ
jgi:hypothetical protein